MHTSAHTHNIQTRRWRQPNINTSLSSNCHFEVYPRMHNKPYFIFDSINRMETIFLLLLSLDLFLGFSFSLCHSICVSGWSAPVCGSSVIVVVSSPMSGKSTHSHEYPCLVQTNLSHPPRTIRDRHNGRPSSFESFAFHCPREIKFIFTHYLSTLVNCFQ